MCCDDFGFVFVCFFCHCPCLAIAVLFVHTAIPFQSLPQWKFNAYTLSIPNDATQIYNIVTLASVLVFQWLLLSSRCTVSLDFCIFRASIKFDYWARALSHAIVCGCEHNIVLASLAISFVYYFAINVLSKWCFCFLFS